MTKHDRRQDDVFMRRALQLAGYGSGQVSPNPLVGCVIVSGGAIIGEGWHQQYGESHAEVNAVNSVADISLLCESTLYVNLEPCSHFGKTPPCADMLIANKVKRVVVSNTDCNPLVSGRGIRKLEDAGIAVTTSVLEHDGRVLNRRFFTMIEKKRPYIILKWAETADGFMARENYDSRWISNEYSRQLTHKWRAEEDAILVGTNTAARDNPQLTVRSWTGRNPVRIVIDRMMQLEGGLHLFDHQSMTMRYNVIQDAEERNLLSIRIENNNFLENMVQDLYDRKIQSLFVEGGPHTLNQFIQHNLWDEARIFRSPQRFEKGIPAPVLKGSGTTEGIFDDYLTIMYNNLQVG
ncbi:MAG: bifunctional diaminohydroxyphosphoribosylaminopyrimidine deaminase/5-amino-6-(5-phosphoribosylamino)uracil reductase RibD [Chryseolinea sp.]